MEGPVSMQRYVPGVEPGPRAWKKEMREAGVPDEFVAVVERMRAKVREEARLGTPIGIEYAFDVLKRDGAEEPWRVRRMASRHIGETPEAEILGLFERTLAGRPAPMLAGFNTSGFDVPVLRYRAIATGVAMPALNGANGRDYGYRFGRDHIDLADRLSGFRASPMPSLAEACSLIGLTAKSGMDGSEVEPAMAAGRGAEVAEYCETDVAATWLLLRYWQATGALPRDAARHSFSGFAAYLEEHHAEAHLADHAETAMRLGEG